MQIMSQFVGTILGNDFSANVAEGAKSAGSSTEPPGAKPDQRLSNDSFYFEAGANDGRGLHYYGIYYLLRHRKEDFKGYGARGQ